MGRVPGTYSGNGGGVPPITIGVISATRTVMPAFARALAVMQKTDGMQLIWMESADVVGNCNAIIRGSRGRSVWLMGDDHQFDPDVLLRLAAHRLDVVVPLCMKRTPPYDPVVYGGQNERGEYTAADLGPGGLHEVYAAGSAGMLISPRVIDAIGDPWFESHGGLNEDLTFCAKVRDAGYSIWCDTDIPLGHINTYTVWPEWRRGAWHVGLELAPRITMPVDRIIRAEVAV